MQRVLVFGTFDIFHKGHESFLKQAKKLGYLTVVVARDRHVEKAKGRLPKNLETKRAQQVRKSGLANKVILGSKTHNFFRTIRTNKIDLIALGYDQRPTIRSLKKDLKKHRLGEVKIVRLRGLRPSIYKTSKLLEA